MDLANKYLRSFLWVMLLAVMAICDIYDPKESVANVACLGLAGIILLDFMNDSRRWFVGGQERIVFAISLLSLWLTIIGTLV